MVCCAIFLRLLIFLYSEHTASQKDLLKISQKSLALKKNKQEAHPNNRTSVPELKIKNDCNQAKPFTMGKYLLVFHSAHYIVFIFISSCNSYANESYCVLHSIVSVSQTQSNCRESSFLHFHSRRELHGLIRLKEALCSLFSAFTLNKYSVKYCRLLRHFTRPRHEETSNGTDSKMARVCTNCIL